MFSDLFKSTKSSNIQQDCIKGSKEEFTRADYTTQGKRQPEEIFTKRDTSCTTKFLESNAVDKEKLTHRELVERNCILHQCVESQKKALECAVCYEVFSIPITIPCGHSFCLTCIINCFSPPSGKGSDRTHFNVEKCPMCRAPIRLELTPSLILRDMVADVMCAMDETAAHCRSQKIESDSQFLKRHANCIRLGAHCTKKMCLRPRSATKQSLSSDVPGAD